MRPNPVSEVKYTMFRCQQAGNEINLLRELFLLFILLLFTVYKLNSKITELIMPWHWLGCWLSLWAEEDLWFDRNKICNLHKSQPEEEKVNESLILKYGHVKMKSIFWFMVLVNEEENIIYRVIYNDVWRLMDDVDKAFKVPINAILSIFKAHLDFSGTFHPQKIGLAS